MRIVKQLFKALLIMALLVYFLHDLNLTLIGEQIGAYSLDWFIISILSVYISVWVLAWRWHYLSNGHCSLQASSESVVISGLMNYILPAKLGELSKLLYLKAYYHHKLHRTSSYLLVERLFDVMMLASLTSIGGLLFLNHNNLWIAPLILLIGGVMIFVIRSQLFRMLLRKIPVRHIRIYALLITKNITATTTPRKLLVLYGITLALWISYFLTTAIFLCFSAGYILELQELYVVFFITSIAMSIPLMPGGAGTFQAGMILALGMYGIGKESALMSGIYLHLVTVLPVAIYAILVIWLKGISLKSLRSEAS